MLVLVSVLLLENGILYHEHWTGLTNNQLDWNYDCTKGDDKIRFNSSCSVGVIAVEVVEVVVVEIEVVIVVVVVVVVVVEVVVVVVVVLDLVSARNQMGCRPFKCIQPN